MLEQVYAGQIAYIFDKRWIVFIASCNVSLGSNFGSFIVLDNFVDMFSFVSRFAYAIEDCEDQEKLGVNLIILESFSLESGREKKL